MRRNLVLLTLHGAFLNMLFIIPVIVPYYHAIGGLSFAQFMVG